MLVEPSPTEFDLRFRLFGIPVRVHPLFWLVSAILGWDDSEPRRVLIWIPAVFVSILVHELGHALCARWLGNRPWIVLYSFGGLAGYDGRRSMSLWERVAILFCGPLAGFLLGAVVLALVIGLGEPQREELFWLVWALLWINFGWGIVNLFPVWPLDGGQIAYNVLHRISPARGPDVARGLSAITGMALAFAGYVLLGNLLVAVFFGLLAVQSLQGGGKYR